MLRLADRFKYKSTGTSTTAVMSQKAVSDALAGITAALGVAESALAEV